MAPATNKRKRPERQTSQDDGSTRPSPYRPDKSRITRRASKDPSKSDDAHGEQVEDTAAATSLDANGQHLDIGEGNTASRPPTLVPSIFDFTDRRTASKAKDKLTLRLLQVKLAGRHRNTSNRSGPG